MRTIAFINQMDLKMGYPKNEWLIIIIPLDCHLGDVSHFQRRPEKTYCWWYIPLNPLNPNSISIRSHEIPRNFHPIPIISMFTSNFPWNPWDFRRFLRTSPGDTVTPVTMTPLASPRPPGGSRWLVHHWWLNQQLLRHIKTMIITIEVLWQFHQIHSDNDIYIHTYCIITHIVYTIIYIPIYIYTIVPSMEYESQSCITHAVLSSIYQILPHFCYPMVIPLIYGMNGY